MKLLFHNGAIDVAICIGVLSTDLVACLLQISWICGQSGSVHQVKEVAVVRPEVQEGQRLRDAVGLSNQRNIPM